MYIYHTAGHLIPTKPKDSTLVYHFISSVWQYHVCSTLITSTNANRQFKLSSAAFRLLGIFPLLRWSDPYGHFTYWLQLQSTIPKAMVGTYTQTCQRVQQSGKIKIQTFIQKCVLPHRCMTTWQQQGLSMRCITNSQTQRIQQALSLGESPHEHAQCAPSYMVGLRLTVSCPFLLQAVAVGQDQDLSQPQNCCLISSL